MSSLLTGMVRAMALKIARQVAAWLAAGTIAWLVAHHANFGDAQTVAEGLAAIITGGASVAFSLLDARTVNAKIVTAAATGSVAAADNSVARAVVAQGAIQGTLTPAQEDAITAALNKAQASKAGS